MIVKVQISLARSDQRVLVYNQDRSVQWEDAVNKEVLALMDGAPKRFFEAWLNSEGGIVLGAVAPWQDW